MSQQKAGEEHTGPAHLLHSQEGTQRVYQQSIRMPAMKERKCHAGLYPAFGIIPDICCAGMKSMPHSVAEPILSNPAPPGCLHTVIVSEMCCYQ